jgi:chromosome segregation ATPase
MTDLFNNEIIRLLALFTTLLATLVLILVGRKALISSKEARLSALDELIKDRKARLGDKGKLEVEVETLTKKQDQLQILTQALQNDLEPLKSKHADAVLEYEKQKEKLRTLREEWRQLQDKVELYEKKIKKLNELEEEIKGLGEQRDALKAEVDSLPKVKEELEKVGADLKQAQESKQKLEEEISFFTVRCREFFS